MPGNSGEVNRTALQRLLDAGGRIRIDIPGVYDITGMLVIGGGTVLEFASGVIIRRRPDGKAWPLLINRGLLSGETDRGIAVRGMHLMCAGTDTDWHTPVIPGICAQLAFFHVENLEISALTCTDLTEQSFCVQVCDFKNLSVEKLHIEGRKDGVHLGCGCGFVIRDAKFRTYDDPIALNAHDYAISTPMPGDISDGLIENCVDLEADSTTGFFCRMLAGAWCDWRPGMVIRNSDTAVSGGRLYRALMSTDGSTRVSVTRPEHTSGVEELDGIRWAAIPGTGYRCGCRNITFRNIELRKRRTAAFCLHFDDDDWSHSVYPGAELPVQRGIVLDRVLQRADIAYLILGASPADDIRLCGCDLRPGVKINLFRLPCTSDIEYPVCNITLSGSAADNPPDISGNGRAVRILRG